jgi:hypothetical protein
MELVSTKPDVKWKKLGLYRLFWKEKAEMKGELNGKHEGACGKSRY